MTTSNTNGSSTGSLGKLLKRDVTGSPVMPNLPIAYSSEPDPSSPPAVTDYTWVVGETDTVTEHCIKWNTEIRDLSDERYDLNDALVIVIEEYPDEETVSARYPELEAFGEGCDETEAIQALKEDLVRLYEDLVDEKVESLGALPRSWQRILKKIITRV